MYIEVIFILAIVLIVGVGARLLFKRQQKKLQLEKERRAQQHRDNQARKFRDRGHNIGGRIFNALKTAAESHPGYAGRLRYASVTKIEDNAGHYSIIVKLQEPGVPRHLQATFQVNIPLIECCGDQIGVLEGNYGPTTYCLINEESLVMLLPRLQEKTRTWPGN